ncbi:MAG: hypothetical protein K5668_04920 [Lachnospiraceae bacterium]|nr:hypothetical protein [Lachnospiraceae bacterium]
MKLSEILFSRAERLWDISVKKPFVTEMAKGTLADEKFRRYTIQDYLYLLEYIEILKEIRELSVNDDATASLSAIIEGTLEEAERVHLPNIRKAGIADDEITKDKELNAVSDYIGFMRECLEKHGFLGGITALLQCSWGYAYICGKIKEIYAEEIPESKYSSWFEAYSCQSYLDSNRIWIDMVDRESEGIDDAVEEIMCQIFEKCAEYENGLWDALYE